MKVFWSKNTFITKDKWFNRSSQRDINKLFEDIKIPHYNTIEIIGVKILRTDSINFQNAHGQIVNKARGVGTDKENVRLLTDSIENNGWDLRHVPPIVEESDSSLYDGFSRHESILTIGKETAPYLVVRRKSAFTVEDVIDEVGLGANNHSQSKRHTIVDFKKRLAAYIIRREQQGIETTIADVVKWFDAIPNTFSDNTVKDAVNETGADASILFVPPAFAADSAMEAADAGIKICVAIVDGIPSHDMIRIKRYMRRYIKSSKMTLVGPNCAGIISPGKSMLGIMQGHI